MYLRLARGIWGLASQPHFRLLHRASVHFTQSYLEGLKLNCKGMSQAKPEGSKVANEVDKGKIV
jgi:hypothetical protein